MRIGKIVLQTRLKKGITQASLAKMAGVSHAAIHRIESEAANGRRETQVRIARAFDMSVGELVMLSIGKEDLNESTSSTVKDAMLKAQTAIIMAHKL